ncbi:MAG: hypothetical protein ACPG8W_21260 [Candidatus Promineifilaceae bacterium]
MDFYLTVEQVLGLAPDKTLMRSTRAIAVPEKWTALACNQSLAWGTFTVPNRPPFNAAIHLSTFAATCSCSSRHSPCNHSLALLILARNDALGQTVQLPPAWANTVMAHGLRIGPAEPEAADKHLRLVRRGLGDLEKWLHDMIRAGLAQLPKRSKAYWDTMAGRLVDTHSPKLAQAVRAWHKLLSSEPNWAEQLLRQLGQTQLLIDAFKRFKTFSAETQNDLRHAIGWRPLSKATDRVLSDRWQVIGSSRELRGRRRILHTWLWGQTTHQYAQLTHPAPTRTQPRQQFLTGTSFNANLSFIRSTFPLRASFRSQPSGLQQIDSYQVAPQSLTSLSTRFNKRRARNFWLDAYPVVLHHSRVQRDEAVWILTDNQGVRLPIEPQFAHGWHLMAIANASLFGIWNGRTFQPLSLWHNQRWIELRLLAEDKS